MEHKGTVYIETKRLILRRFELRDCQSSFYNWTNDEKVTEFLRWSTHDSIETTQMIIQEWIDNYKNKKFYQWAILLKENCEGPIGTISVVDQNVVTNCVHIGYCIGSQWWNKGITSEAFLAIIRFFFEEVKVNRIESQHDPINVNSGKVMIKCGLLYEGTLRQADINNRGIVDAKLYSILAKDYNQKEKFKNESDI